MARIILCGIFIAILLSVNADFNDAEGQLPVEGYLDEVQQLPSSKIVPNVDADSYKRQVTAAKITDDAQVQFPLPSDQAAVAVAPNLEDIPFDQLIRRAGKGGRGGKGRKGRGRSNFASNSRKRRRNIRRGRRPNAGIVGLPGSTAGR